MDLVHSSDAFTMWAFVYFILSTYGYYDNLVLIA